MIPRAQKRDDLENEIYTSSLPVTGVSCCGGGLSKNEARGWPLDVRNTYMAENHGNHQLI
jgi:hypothetical protein